MKVIVSTKHITHVDLHQAGEIHAFGTPTEQLLRDCTCVSIRHNKYEHDGPERYGERSHLTGLFKQPDSLSKFYNLTSLDFASVTMLLANVEFIATFVEQSHTLQVLYLTDCDICPSGLRRISDMVGRNLPHLQELSLSNSLTKVDDLSIAQLLFTTQKNTHLRTLSFFEWCAALEYRPDITREFTRLLFVNTSLQNIFTLDASLSYFTNAMFRHAIWSNGSILDFGQQRTNTPDIMEMHTHMENCLRRNIRNKAHREATFTDYLLFGYGWDAKRADDTSADLLPAGHGLPSKKVKT